MQQYAIKPNDTLYLIAKEFKIPLVQLAKANPQITNPNLLYIGQIIQIPDPIPIPKQMDIIESNAEDIIEDIYNADWQKAEDKVNIIKMNLSELMPILQTASVPRESIAGINQAVMRLEENVMQEKVYPSIGQANLITMHIPDILDYFKIIIPTDVGRLDFLGRSIILNVENNDWAEANNNYLRAKMIWERLKPTLDPKYSKDITEFDQILNDLHQSISEKNYQATIENANRMLDKVDILETNFTQQNT